MIMDPFRRLVRSYFHFDHMTIVCDTEDDETNAFQMDFVLSNRHILRIDSQLRLWTDAVYVWVLI